MPIASRRRSEPRSPACASARFWSPSVMLLVFGAVGVILWIGGHDVVAGKLAPRASSPHWSSTRAIVAGAVGAISEVVGDLQRAAGATERLLELLAVEPAIRTVASGSRCRVPRAAGRLRPRDLSGYSVAARRRGPRATSRSRSAAGDNVALVGPSGAGKTTVFRCCCASAVRRRARCASTASTSAPPPPRTCVHASAVVPQDPVVFATSVLGEHALWTARRQRGRGASRPAKRPSRPIHGATAGGVRQRSRRAGRSAFRRAAAAARHRARDPGGPSGSAAGVATGALDAESERVVQARARAIDGRAAPC